MENWFKVGAIIFFRGLDPATEVMSIDKDNNSCIGRDCEGDRLYSLDEISKHWSPVHIGIFPLKDKDFKKYIELKGFL